jgi:hypothetical protein
MCVLIHALKIARKNNTCKKKVKNMINTQSLTVVIVLKYYKSLNHLLI